MTAAFTPAHHTAQPPRHNTAMLALAAALAVTLAGCGTPRPAPVAPGTAQTASTPSASQAATARAYRQDAAHRLYGLNAGRIYPGRLPPLLYAVGTLELDIDGSGRITKLNWLRAPKHAPEVIAEIERTVRAAQPFPQPVRLGKVTYTETWLWDKSGRFQLDTLTEGQMGQE